MLEYFLDSLRCCVCVCVSERCGCWWREFWVNLRSCINELNRQFIDQKWNSWGIFHRSILLSAMLDLCRRHLCVFSIISNHCVGIAICMFASKHFVHILWKTRLARANVCEHLEIMHRFSTIYPMEKSMKNQLSSCIHAHTYPVQPYKCKMLP